LKKKTAISRTTEIIRLAAVKRVPPTACASWCRFEPFMLVVNVIALWNTSYRDAAPEQLRSEGYSLKM
jgi:hypothetical protein